MRRRFTDRGRARRGIRRCSPAVRPRPSARRARSRRPTTCVRMVTNSRRSRGPLVQPVELGGPAAGRGRVRHRGRGDRLDRRDRPRAQRASRRSDSGCELIVTVGLRAGRGHARRRRRPIPTSLRDRRRDRRGRRTSSPSCSTPRRRRSSPATSRPACRRPASSPRSAAATSRRSPCSWTGSSTASPSTTRCTARAVRALGWDKAKQDGAFTGDFEDINKGKAPTRGLHRPGRRRDPARGRARSARAPPRRPSSAAASR